MYSVDAQGRIDTASQVESDLTKTTLLAQIHANNAKHLHFGHQLDRELPHNNASCTTPHLKLLLVVNNLFKY